MNFVDDKEVDLDLLSMIELVNKETYTSSIFNIYSRLQIHKTSRTENFHHSKKQFTTVRQYSLVW